MLRQGWYWFALWIFCLPYPHPEKQSCGGNNGSRWRQFQVVSMDILPRGTTGPVPHVHTWENEIAEDVCCCYWSKFCSRTSRLRLFLCSYTYGPVVLKSDILCNLVMQHSVPKCDVAIWQLYIKWICSCDVRLLRLVFFGPSCMYSTVLQWLERERICDWAGALWVLGFRLPGVYVVCIFMDTLTVRWKQLRDQKKLFPCL